MDDIDLNRITMRQKFEAEVERLKKFQRSFAGVSGIATEKEIDLREYAKYVLKEGSVTEKRELLLCIKSRLVLSQKILKLEK
jgi:hypothetical protein